MRRLIYILLMPFMLVVFWGCKRNEIYYPNNAVGGVAVRIDLLWPKGEAAQQQKALITLPSGFYACFFPKSAVPFVDYLNTYGGVVNLYEGDYSVLSVNNDTEVVKYRGTTSYETFEAYTPEVLRASATKKGEFEIGVAQPDMLFVAGEPLLHVYETTDTLTLTKRPQAMVSNYQFRYSGVVGIENLNLIRAVIRGVSSSVMLASNEMGARDGQIFLTVQKTSDGFRGDFNTFMRQWPAEGKYEFEVEFIQGSSVTTLTYNVGDMLRTKGRIEIQETLVFDKPSDGGFDTDLGDWKEDDVEIPI